jgi:hypothetical protein
MSAWLMEVLAVSDLQAPLSLKPTPMTKSVSTGSLDSMATATSFTTTTTTMSDRKETMPSISTWNFFEENKQEGPDDEEWEEQDPGEEMAC